MNCRVAILKKVSLLVLFCIVLCKDVIYSQETNSNFGSTTSYHNQLIFNRFLVHPAFSLVRENKSYVNILHRNQYATFNDNDQNYFIGFSNKINDHTAMGIGIHTHRAGVIQEFGLNANYATSVQLSRNSKLSFGTNITYLNSGIDKHRIIASENDPEILDARKETKVAFQPGIALSYGQFDLGLYAINLISYNQTTNSILTDFNDKTLKASLQYTHEINARRGLFANSRIMPLLQVHNNEGVSLAGSLVLDLPEYGWLQTTVDDSYGLSLGLGLNLGKKMSLGYVFEKNFMKYGANLGSNHELSLAYTFKENLFHNNSRPLKSNTRAITKARKQIKFPNGKINGTVKNQETQILKRKAEIDKKEGFKHSIFEQPSIPLKEVSSNKGSGNQMFRLTTDKTNDCECQNDLAYQNHLLLKELLKNLGIKDHIVNLTVNTDKNDECQNTLAYQNRLILDGLILRQDSLETAYKRDLEKRFDMLVRILKEEIKQTIKSDFKNSENKEYETTVADIQEKTIYRINNPEQKDYVKSPIKIQQQSNIIGVPSGYYLVANVYKNKENVDSFIEELNHQGLNAKQFFNKENGLYYVYLANYSTKNDAETAFITNLEGTYQKDKWIMRVYDHNATVGNLFEDQDHIND